MARTYVVRQRRRQVPARRQAGRAARPVRACVATATVALSAALPLLRGQADAQQVNAVHAGQLPRAPLALTVTSVSPSYAEQGRTVTITGRVRNLAAAPASGLSVQLLSSKTQLGSRLYLENYASGNYLPLMRTVSTAPVTLARLDSGHSWSWTVRLPVRDLGLSCFGVYPLTVEVRDAAFDVARDPVPLPYWPAKANSCPGQRRPQPFAISWIWPLIDVPHQGVCAGLIDNRLATSIAPDGRLGNLLAIGSRYSARAGLTWAIDPSLLDSVAAMRHSYSVGASAKCRPGTELPASPAASRWMAGLLKATAGQPVFLTPYADVDVAALTRHGSQFDLDRAFAEAAHLGHQILHRNAPAPIPAGPHQLSAVAWPASGIASEAVLAFLAAEHVSTVILAAPAVSPVRYTPGAVASKLTGIGKQLHILLADHAITALLRSKGSAARQAGSIFGTGQLYLAETAMIASEAPGTPRPIVVAPPRRWDPPRQLASNLLAETVSAPWLKPSTAGQLVTMRSERIYPSFTQSDPGAELPGRLLSKVSKLDHRLALLQSIRVRPDPALNRAVLGIESSAWRGKGGKHARALLARTTRYVNSQLGGISIRGVSVRGGNKHVPYHVTFGGKTAPVNVVIHNALRYTVQVGLLVQANHAEVSGKDLTRITIPPENFSSAVTLTVHVQSKQGKIRLTLVSPKGTPLAGHPLPAAPLVIIVHPTNFGTLALAIFAVALALFVTGSAFRAIRNGRPAFPSAPDGGPDDPAGPEALDEHARSAAPEEQNPSAASGEPELSAAPEKPAPSAAGAEPAPSAASGEPASSYLAPLAAGPPPAEGTSEPSLGSGGGGADLPPGAAPAGLPLSGAHLPDGRPAEDGRPKSASELPARPERHPAGSAGPVAAGSPSAWIPPPGLGHPIPGDAAVAQEGFPDRGDRPEYIDSVGGDGSGRTSPGPSVLDQESAAPSRRATEEPR